MNRRAFLSLSAAATFVAMLPLPAAAQQLPLSELSRYLNSFSTATAEFTQINPDGTLSTGRLHIHRPGRVRFEYDPPERNLVLATAGSVNVFDARSNQGPTVYPLRRTPLNLILAANVDLSRDRMVVRHYAEGPTTVVVAQDPEHPEYGSIRLVFSAGPTELRQWIVTDDMGRETTVILGDMRTGVQLPSRLFNVDDAVRQRSRSNQR
ncbi:outer membrane lipoprotein carrier protein LolA [Pararhodobacter sp. SW119]|uniref:LolA family protein n=1 Tax=Pararhodobacter sp. SW119 TaxID=2780075 RepID=UPI001ADF14A5|nr:outer membrane lipoprotein carrier protein LolA [Pararhodobacter sp. SW119]